MLQWIRQTFFGKTNIKITETSRGFEYGEFEDANDVLCNIQVSSSIQEEALIWLGADEIGLKCFKSNQGWEDVELDCSEGQKYIANTRMHLTQSQVKDLLPILTKFAKTGSLE